jgi:hypothetical protein
VNILEAALVRKLALSMCLSTFMALFSLNAAAEGGCPPGQYPIGGQGVLGCAPIAEGGGAAHRAVPTGRWIKTWGAIATSKSGDAGASKGKMTKADAAQEAIAQCAQWGATDCKVGLAYKNQCVAVIQADKGMGSKLDTGADEAVAIERATRECKRVGSTTCKVLYSSCSDPVFEAF